MLHYGHLRPSADYFNSNFMVSNFLVIDLTNNNINVFFYDERAQGKDVDALFSLQFTYHLEKFKMLLSRKIGMPKILLVILNNLSFKTSRNLSCNSSFCSPSCFTRRSCWCT
jgi:hypothetical protein